jgi:hypothetical protein
MRSADYSPSDDRAWREAQDEWVASEGWLHPDPDLDAGDREFIARLFAFGCGVLVTVAIIGAAVYFRFHGA